MEVVDVAEKRWQLHRIYSIWIGVVSGGAGGGGGVGEGNGPSKSLRSSSEFDFFALTRLLSLDFFTLINI